MAVLTPIRARAIEQGTTGVSRIDGSVGLNDALNRTARHRLNFSAQSADDTGRKRLVEAKGIADGEDALPYLQILRRTDRNRLKPICRCIDPQNRNVLIRCHTNAARLPCRLIAQGHLRDVRILNHMEIGNDISAMVPDKTGARAFGYLIKIKGEEIPLHGDRRDMQYRRRSLAE